MNGEDKVHPTTDKSEEAVKADFISYEYHHFKDSKPSCWWCGAEIEEDALFCRKCLTWQEDRR